MTAKEMFEALGYTYYKSNNMILYEISEINYFIFSPDKEITVGDYGIDVATLEAINQQCKELGWIYKGEVMHDLKALFDNAGDYFEDEYELVKQYIEQLEQALDKACEELEVFDMTFNDGDFVDIKNKEQWKEWTLQNRK